MRLATGPYPISGGKHVTIPLPAATLLVRAVVIGNLTPAAVTVTIAGETSHLLPATANLFTLSSGCQGIVVTSLGTATQSGTITAEWLTPATVPGSGYPVGGAVTNLTLGADSTVKITGPVTISGTVDLAAGTKIGITGAVDLAAGTKVVLATGSTVALAATTEVKLPAGTKVGVTGDVSLAAGTTVALAAGTEVKLPTGQEVSLAAGTAVKVSTAVTVAGASSGTAATAPDFAARTVSAASSASVTLNLNTATLIPAPGAGLQLELHQFVGSCRSGGRGLLLHGATTFFAFYTGTSGAPVPFNFGGARLPVNTALTAEHATGSTTMSFSITYAVVT